MDLDFESAVFGAATSLVSQVLFFVLQGFSKAIGRFNVFCRVISHGDETTTFGVKFAGSSVMDMLFQLPLRITIQNNKKIQTSMRDFRVAIYSNDEFCCFLTPVRKIVLEKNGISEEEMFKYDFSIPPQSLIEQVCVFECNLLPFMSKCNIEFKVFYYNDKNIQLVSSLFKTSCLTQDFGLIDFSESIPLKFVKYRPNRDFRRRSSDSLT